jgi:hypothetical protein
MAQNCWYPVCMPPEITELRSLTTHDKQRKASRRAIASTYAHLAESLRNRSSLNVVRKSFPHNAALSQSDFVHSVVFVLVAAISQIINQEHP